MEYLVTFLYDGNLRFAHFKNEYAVNSDAFLEALAISMGEALKLFNEKPLKARISDIDLYKVSSKNSFL